MAEAATTYQQAVELAQTLGKQNVGLQILKVAALAGLAHVLSTRGTMLRAVAKIEEALSQMQAYPKLYGAWEPLRVYLDCYQVLRAADDSRARQVLEQGRALLQEWAAKITDGSLRRSCLGNVAANRELAAEWEQYSPPFALH